MPRHLSSWFLAALAVASLVYFVPAQVAADMISSAPVSAPASAPGLQIQTPAANGVVSDALRAQGLEETEIAARLAELCPQDGCVLADSPQQVQLAGGTYFGLIAIIFVGFLIFALILYLLD